jgi:hypothetical protein
MQIAANGNNGRPIIRGPPRNGDCRENKNFFSGGICGAASRRRRRRWKPSQSRKNPGLPIGAIVLAAANNATVAPAASGRPGAKAAARTRRGDRLGFSRPTPSTHRPPPGPDALLGLGDRGCGAAAEFFRAPSPAFGSVVFSESTWRLGRLKK